MWITDCSLRLLNGLTVFGEKRLFAGKQLHLALFHRLLGLLLGALLGLELLPLAAGLLSLSLCE